MLPLTRKGVRIQYTILYKRLCAWIHLYQDLTNFREGLNKGIILHNYATFQMLKAEFKWKIFVKKIYRIFLKSSCNSLNCG